MDEYAYQEGAAAGAAIGAKAKAAISEEISKAKAIASAEAVKEFVVLENSKESPAVKEKAKNRIIMGNNVLKDSKVLLLKSRPGFEGYGDNSMRVLRYNVRGGKKLVAEEYTSSEEVKMILIDRKANYSFKKSSGESTPLVLFSQILKDEIAFIYSLVGEEIAPEIKGVIFSRKFGRPVYREEFIEISVDRYNKEIKDQIDNGGDGSAIIGDYELVGYSQEKIKALLIESHHELEKKQIEDWLDVMAKLAKDTKKIFKDIKPQNAGFTKKGKARLIDLHFITNENRDLDSKIFDLKEYGKVSTPLYSPRFIAEPNHQVTPNFFYGFETGRSLASLVGYALQPSQSQLKKLCEDPELAIKQDSESVFSNTLLLEDKNGNLSACIYKTPRGITEKNFGTKYHAYYKKIKALVEARHSSSYTEGLLLGMGAKLPDNCNRLKSSFKENLSGAMCNELLLQIEGNRGL